MSTKQLMTIILVALALNLLGQSSLTTTVFEGQTFYKLGDKWNLFDESSQEFVELADNQISILFTEGTTSSQISSFAESNNLVLVNHAITGWCDFRFTPSNDLFEKCDSLLNKPLIQSIEVTAPLQFHINPPNDSAYQNIYTYQYYQWSIPQVGIENAWVKTTGDTNTVIAIIDSGVDWWEQDFIQATGTSSGTFWVNKEEDAWTDPNDPTTGNGIDDDGNGFIDDWRGWDFAFNDNNPSDGQMPHGTGVLSIAGARTNNSIGMAGVAGGWSTQNGVRFMILKVGEMGNYNPNHNWAVMDDAILYAAKNGADIINISMGTGGTNQASISDAIDSAYEKYNCVIIASSGNVSGTPTGVKFPARHPNVIGVSKTNLNNTTLQSYIGDNLDLGAPGHILPILNAGKRFSPHTQYINQTGTSLAAPLVAGVAGLMHSINPCIDNKENYNILRYRADTVHSSTDPNSNYYYHWNLDRPWHSKAMGYGLVNANKAVNTAEAMKSQTIDLYIKDRFDDFGYSNSYPNNVRFDEGPDIWARNQNDGRVNQFDEQIEYDSQNPAFVYVRVHNKSCVPSFNNEEVHLYWSKASGDFSWPHEWNGTNPNIGDLLGIIDIGLLEAGEDTILEFQWNINPNIGQNHWGTCLYARIESPQEPNAPITNLGTAIRNSNNMAIKNLRIENIFPGKVRPNINGIDYPHGIFMFVGNNQHNNSPVDIHFDIPDKCFNQSIVEAAEVQIFVDENLWNKINTLSPEDKFGIEIVEEKKLLITENHAYIKNVPFELDERNEMFVGFSFLTQEMQEKNSFKFHVQQFNQENELVGAMNFRINRGNRDDFEANAGSDELIDKGTSVTLNAEDINESATYNWYDSNDSLIYSGISPTLSPEITEQYKLEVIADADGFKDYDEIVIEVNPYFLEEIYPNPATSAVTINYEATEANSAYLMVYNTATGNSSNNYILNTSNNNINLNLSSYNTGIYTVILVCDGQIVDAKQLSIQ